MIKWGGLSSLVAELNAIFSKTNELSIKKTENGEYSVIYNDEPNTFLIRLSDSMIELGNGTIKIKLGAEWSFKMTSRVLGSSQPSHKAWLWFDSTDYDYHVGYFWEDWLSFFEEYINALEALIKFIGHNPHVLLSEEERKTVIKSDEFKNYLKGYLRMMMYSYKIDKYIEHIDKLIEIIYRISGLDKYIESGPNFVLSEISPPVNPQ